MTDKDRSGLLQDVKDLEPREFGSPTGDTKDSGGVAPDRKEGADSDGSDSADSDGSDGGSERSDRGGDGTDTSDSDGSDSGSDGVRT